MVRLDDPGDDGDLSWLEVLSVIGLAVVFLVGAGYIALRLVGVL